MQFRFHTDRADQAIGRRSPGNEWGRSQIRSPKKANRDRRRSPAIFAAMIKKKVPVEITKDESVADYVIAGSSIIGNNKWYDTVFGVEKDRNQGSIQLIRVVDKTVEFAANAGDKSRWFSEWKKGGREKVANRLAKKLKDHFNKKDRRS